MDADILVSTFDSATPAASRLLAIRMYCQGVKEDFPETSTWMNNILFLSGINPTGE